MVKEKKEEKGNACRWKRLTEEKRKKKEEEEEGERDEERVSGEVKQKKKRTC